MKYFAYGSNMNRKRLEERVGKENVYVQDPAFLKGYELTFNKQSSYSPEVGYANIVSKEGSIVFGCLYDVSDNSLALLDKYEGVHDHHYERTEVQVFSGLYKMEVTAFTYIARPERITEGLLPTQEYLNHLLKGKNFLPESYFTILKNTLTFEGKKNKGE